MAVTTLYFGASSAGAADGTTWANRAAFVSGGAINTLISAFDFTSNSLIARVGPGTHTLTTGIATFTGTTTPSLSFPCMIEAALSDGTRWQSPDPDWCSAQPAWDAADATYPMPVIATTTNIATLNNANVNVFGIKFTASGRNGAIVSNSGSMYWCQFANSTSNTSAACVSSSPTSIRNCSCVCSGTSYDYTMSSSAVAIDNVRCEGNSSASSGTRKGFITGLNSSVSRMTVVKNPGGGMDHTATGTSARIVAYNCTVADNAGNGITQNGTSSTLLGSVSRCMITGSHTYGINAAGTGNMEIYECRIRDYTSAAVTSNLAAYDPSNCGNDTTAGTNSDEYVDSSSGDYRIKNTSSYWGRNLGAGDGPAAASGGGSALHLGSLGQTGIGAF